MNTSNCSTIVTPPDFIPKQTNIHTVLLIDPSNSEIEDVAFFLKTSPKTFTVYVYCVAMNDREWIHNAMAQVDAIVVNTEQNADSSHKDVLSARAGEIYHYGEKTFLMTQNHRIESPVDYFIAYTTKEPNGTL